MNNNVLNLTNILIIGQTEYDILPSGKYEVNDKRITSNNGEILGHVEVNFEDIDIDNREHQSRVGDVDLGHLSEIRDSIKGDDLRVLPIGIIDPVTSCFVPLSGHHRILAMRELDYKKIPVLVISMPARRDRREFCQEENNPLPSKGHNKDDAVHYIRECVDDGEFFGLSELATKRRIIKSLKKHYTTLSDSKRKEVYNRVFQGSSPRSKTYSKAELGSEISKCNHDKLVKSGTVENGNAFSVGDRTNTTKVLGSIEDKVFNTRAQNPSAPTMKVTTMLYFNKRSGDIVQALKDCRKEFVTTMTNRNNQCYLKSDDPAMFISTIIFLPQVLFPKKDKETAWIVWNWDGAAEKFVLRAKALK
jgi:hypothetical protein